MSATEPGETGAGVACVPVTVGPVGLVVVLIAQPVNAVETIRNTETAKKNLLISISISLSYHRGDAKVITSGVGLLQIHNGGKLRSVISAAAVHWSVTCLVVLAISIILLFVL